MVIKGNFVYLTAFQKMNIEDYVKWQLDNMKRYCELFSSNSCTETQFYCVQQIDRIQCELVNSFGFSWEEVEKHECASYNDSKVS